MTEAEWLGCTDPFPMRRLLASRSHFGRNRITLSRKERLFAVACCRRIWHLLTDGRSRQAVLAAEAYADGLIDGEQRRACAAEASRVVEALGAPGTLAVDV